jgi:hypothetical protein
MDHIQFAIQTANQNITLLQKEFIRKYKILLLISYNIFQITKLLINLGTHQIKTKMKIALTIFHSFLQTNGT